MNRLNELVEKAFSRQALHTADLPGLDLYMDQVITLVENGYAANKRTAEEKLLTKTMVQNYSKAGLVRPIKGKKYTPGHIVQMLAIYSLKRTLTIGEIKQALDALYAQREENRRFPTAMSARFLKRMLLPAPSPGCWNRTDSPNAGAAATPLPPFSPRPPFPRRLPASRKEFLTGISPPSKRPAVPDRNFFTHENFPGCIHILEETRQAS